VPPAAAPAGPPPTYGAPPPYAAPSYSYPPSYYQPYYPPARQRLDRGLTLGGGIGFGGLSFRDSFTRNENAANGMAYTFRLGVGLRPGLILMWDLEGTLISDGPTTISQTANLAALQIFLGQRFFLKGGFGVAQVVENDVASRWGGAGMLGLGYELVQGWNWSLGLEATITGARYNYTGGYESWTNWSLVNFVVSFF
jgi:hypothetical protein